MKVMLAGDTHGYIAAIEYLMFNAQREGCDAIFQVGDFGFWEHAEEGVDFLDDVAGLAENYNIPLFALDGNHDKTSLVLEKYKATWAPGGFMTVRPNVFYSPRGNRWHWNGVRFISLGGAYSVDKWIRVDEEKDKSAKIRKRNAYRGNYPKSEDTTGTLWFPEEEMTDEDMAGFLVDGSPVDVILAHDKPRASDPGWNRKDEPECWPNQDRLQLAIQTLQPKLFVHGHLHLRYNHMIRVTGDTWCQVEGLGSERHGHYSAWSGQIAAHPYVPKDSWAILDLSKGQPNFIGN